MIFNPYNSDLPITEVFDELKQRLQETNTVLLSAPAGAGKSTLIPIALYKEAWLGDKKIIMLEPRRLAARAIAERLAELLGEKVGETVGYRIRFETVISARTKIEIVTEGILTRMLQSDNSLEEYGLVIFDEFHERSLNADLAMALARESQTILRPDMRILIMSATLDLLQLATLLNAPVVKSDGRQYPIEINYSSTDCELAFVSELVCKTVVQSLQNDTGDILVFLPGQGEIKKCAETLKRITKNTSIHELYGNLPKAKQQAAIRPNRSDKRKIVLATSIAETSLTIEGVKVVIDTGLGRTLKFDPRTGLSGLKTIQISKSSADQRAGRAGRLGPGKCYRLWTKISHERMKEHLPPEIMDADLTPLALELAQWGIADITQLTWLDTPPPHHVFQAKELLEDLGAISKGIITEDGKRMAQIPTHPRIAHMLIKAKEQGLLGIGTDLAAILDERDPLPKESGIDITLRIEALRRFRNNNGTGGIFGRIEKIAKQYRKLFNSEVDNTFFDPFDVGMILVHAYPERIAFARPGNNAQFQLSNGNYATAGHRDDLAHEPWLAIAHMNVQEDTGRIFLAAPLNPKDLLPFVKEHTVTTWNTKKGGLIAQKETRIGRIILKTEQLSSVDEDLLHTAISHVIRKEGGHLLDFNEAVQNWQNRIATVKKWYPNESWPNTSLQFLLDTNEEWLTPYLNDIKRPEDLKKIDLYQILKYSLTLDQQRLLNELAPKYLDVPSGSKIQIVYQRNGSSPVVAVRIQEVFGMQQTPTVNNGKTPILLHLLSPAFKPVQITSDLTNFWEHTYFEVRKELRIKYKKHAWPENPREHPAIKGTKKQNNL